MPSREPRFGQGGGGGGPVGAASVSYTPTDPADWPDPDPTNAQQGFDSLADQVASLAAGLQPTGTVFTVDVGGTADADRGVYTTFPAAHTAARAIADTGAQVVIKINQGTAPMTGVATLNMAGIELVGEAGPTKPILTVDDGAELQNLRKVTNLQLNFSNTGGDQLTWGSLPYLLLQNALLNNAGAAEVASVAPAATLTILTQGEGLSLSGVIVDVEGTGTLNLKTLGNTSVANDTVEGAVGAVMNYQYAGESTRATFASLPGAFLTETLLSKSTLTQYTPTTPGNWAPAPTEAGGGLDQLASRTQALESLSGTVPVHGIGSASHSQSTLAELNSKVSDATLDGTGTARPVDVPSTVFNYVPADVDQWGGSAPESLKQALDIAIARASSQVPDSLTGPGDYFWPASIPNVVAWWRADLGVTLGGPGVDGNPRLLSWVDQIGGYDLANSADDNTNPEWGDQAITGGGNFYPGVTLNKAFTQRLIASVGVGNMPLNDYPFTVLMLIRPKTPYTTAVLFEPIFGMGAGDSLGVPNTNYVWCQVGKTNLTARDGTNMFPYSTVGISAQGCTTELAPAGSGGYTPNLWQTYAAAMSNSAGGADTRKARVGKGVIQKPTNAESVVNSDAWDYFSFGAIRDGQTTIPFWGNADAAEIVVVADYVADQVMDDWNTHVERFYKFTLPTPI